jgi:hypothetical protein
MRTNKKMKNISQKHPNDFVVLGKGSYLQGSLGAQAEQSLMNENLFKRQIVTVFRREKEITLADAARVVGVAPALAWHWLREDSCFEEAMQVAAIARSIRFVADAFDLAFSSRELSKEEEETLSWASGLYDFLCCNFPELGLPTLPNEDFSKGIASPVATTI